LGKAGSTSIAPDEDDRLKKFWEKTDIWPRTDEQATSIMGDRESTIYFSKFCPEVAFDRFGYFATYLGRYADELDSDMAVKLLTKEGAASEDWRWNWAGVTEMHYTDCPLYSILAHRVSIPSGTELSKHKTTSKFNEFYNNHPFLIWLIGTILTIVGIIIGYLSLK
jgi:hypothetical protein